MSAPLRMTADDLLNVAGALSQLTRIRKDYGVEVGAYGSARITRLGTDETDETVLSVRWNDAHSRYEIDDRIGE